MQVRVRVTVGSKKESILTKDEIFHIKVKEKAERNLANRRVIEILAEQFGVLQKQVKLVRGHHSPSKTFSVYTTK